MEYYKNIILSLMLYSGFITLLGIGYWAAISTALSRFTKTLRGPQKAIISFAAGITIFTIILFFTLYHLDYKIDTNLGQVGDFVGGILNPLLSFLALIAVLVSISLQEREISDSVSSLEKQEKLIRLQAFESSFFNLLTMFREQRNQQTTVNASGNKLLTISKKMTKIKSQRKILETKYGDTRKQHMEAKKYITENMNVVCCSALIRQCRAVSRFIKNAELPPDQEAHYLYLFYTDLHSHELAMLMNLTTTSKTLRSFIATTYHYKMKDEWMISPYMHRYLKNSNKIHTNKISI